MRSWGVSKVDVGASFSFEAMPASIQLVRNAQIASDAELRAELRATSLELLLKSASCVGLVCVVCEVCVVCVVCEGGSFSLEVCEEG